MMTQRPIPPNQFPARKCLGCGYIHPGPFFDEKCPSLKNKKRGDGGQSIVDFCSELSTFLFSQKDAEEYINKIKKLLDM